MRALYLAVDNTRRPRAIDVVRAIHEATAPRVQAWRSRPRPDALAGAGALRVATVLLGVAAALLGALL